MSLRLNTSLPCDTGSFSFLSQRLSVGPRRRPSPAKGSKRGTSYTMSLLQHQLKHVNHPPLSELRNHDASSLLPHRQPDHGTSAIPPPICCTASGPQKCLRSPQAAPRTQTTTTCPWGHLPHHTSYTRITPAKLLHHHQRHGASATAFLPHTTSPQFNPSPVPAVVVRPELLRRNSFLNYLKLPCSG